MKKVFLLAVLGFLLMFAAATRAEEKLIVLLDADGKGWDSTRSFFLNDPDKIAHEAWPMPLDERLLGELRKIRGVDSVNLSGELLRITRSGSRDWVDIAYDMRPILESRCRCLVYPWFATFGYPHLPLKSARK